MVNYNVMERRHQRLLLLVSITLFVTIIDSATALAHLKSNEHESSPIEGASLAAGRCGCMIGPAGPPGIPGVPGKWYFRCSDSEIRLQKNVFFFQGRPTPR